MQKVKTAKIISFLVLILLTTISCQKDTQNDDIKILEIVLQEKQNQFKNNIFLNPKGNSEAASGFFRSRNMKKRTFTIEYEDTIPASDTLTQRKGKTVYKDKKITSNDYLLDGKGIDENLELFLKDSFNYKQERIIHWTVPKSLKNISLKKEDSENVEMIRISAPVYNLNKNKAIVFSFQRTSKNTATHSIYFIEYKNGNWNIIYTEKSDMFLDLKIE